MPKIANLFQIGNSSLQTARTGMTVAGHNIANASTPGYSRQKVVTESKVETSIQPTGPSSHGSGVQISEVKRINDDYLAQQINQAQREFSTAKEKDEGLIRLEQIFNDVGEGGLNETITNFFNTFQSLANEPNSIPLREMVKEKGKALCHSLHGLYQSLQHMHENLQNRIESECTQYNTLCKSICDLNQQIQNLETNQQAAPNDLLDKRDLALSQLAEILPVRTYFNEKKQLNIHSPAIGPLLTGTHFESLQPQRTGSIDSPFGSFTQIQFANLDETFVSSRIPSGKLGALLELQNHTLPGLYEKLNTLTYELVHSVNSLHEQGFNCKNEQNSFFKPFPEGGPHRYMEQLALDPAIVEDARNISAAFAPDSPGDNRLALQLAKIPQKKLFQEGTLSLEDMYRSVVGEIGHTKSSSTKDMQAAENVVTQLSRLREHLSGVSIDEETTILMQLEHVFNASARIIQIADDMLKTILSIGGRN